MKLEVCPGLAVIAYKSKLDKRWVVEIETEEGGKVAHDTEGRPQIKVMLNEAIISNVGGEEPLASEECPYCNGTGMGRLGGVVRSVDCISCMGTGRKP